MTHAKAVAKIVVTTKQGRVAQIGLSGGVEEVWEEIEAVIRSGDVNAFVPLGSVATGGSIIRVGSIASVEVVRMEDAHEPPCEDVLPHPEDIATVLKQALLQNDVSVNDECDLIEDGGNYALVTTEDGRGPSLTFAEAVAKAAALLRKKAEG